MHDHVKSHHQPFDITNAMTESQTGFTRLRWLASLLSIAAFAPALPAQSLFRAGVSAIDISPRALPAIRNGGFLQATSSRVDDPLHARSLVLADGNETIAIVIVDSCMFPTDVCDAVKQRVSDEVGLPTNRIMISATHTHSAPSVMAYCLGSGRDEAYTSFVIPRVAEGVVAAFKSLRPAEIGWTSVDAGEFTNCRRWITRSDRMGIDPFGQQTVRAMMHPGYLNPDYVSPAGPIDPQLSILSVRSRDGSPICLLANFSMHYFGAGGGFSADYFGDAARRFESRIAEVSGKPTEDFVGIMSQGTSGDLHWMNYGDVRRDLDRVDYASGLADKALHAWKQIEHRRDVTLAMAEKRLEIGRRLPDQTRLAWARPINQERAEQPPRSREEVYAQQAEWIQENPKAELVLQAIRIGELGITAMPNEVYGITGLKIKKQSPLASTFNCELANGAEGYIPPPEQHRLGGYTTWPVRTAGLEEQAEPKIVETVLSLLETVANKPRRQLIDPETPYSREVAALKPIAYWRLDDLTAEAAFDTIGTTNAEYRGAVALQLDGPASEGFAPGVNRSVYFAGGSLNANLPDLPDAFSVSFAFWNGLPVDGRDRIGTLFRSDSAEALSILASEEAFAKLSFESLVDQQTGDTPLGLRAWHHVLIACERGTAIVYLDGKRELQCKRSKTSGGEFVLGEFDGKLDEVVVFDRALSQTEAASLYAASQLQPPPRPAPRKRYGEKPSDAPSLDRYAQTVRESKPIAYWRLHDSDPRTAEDEVGEKDGSYEPNAQPRTPGTTNKNFDGGRMVATATGLGNQYSVEFWVRNELPINSRPVTGYLFTRGVNGADGAPGDHLGIGGTHSNPGRLFVFNGNARNQVVAGTTPVAWGSWHHVAMTRDDANVRVFLNGQLEIADSLPPTYPDGCGDVQIGGRNDNFANLQGMLDEVAIYDRVLTAAEIQQHFVVAGAKEVGEFDASDPKQPEPTDAGESVGRIHVRDGYEVQLVASEPQVKDPVAIDWGVDGKLWVAEMADYPLGMDGKGKPGGRVRVLEDRDHDGHYESSTLFADELPFPTGVLVWGDGVLVTAAPEIVYLQDSTGDGRADVRRTLFSGFLEGNQQLRVNGLRLGLDNWVHCASGSHHGGYGAENRITSVISGVSHPIGSRDFRIRPDTGEIDPLSGPSQYGRNRDDWGNWFGVQNSHPLWHYVLSDADIRRNPYFAPPDPKHQVVTPTNPKVYPASALQKRFHSFDQSGRFTSACSAMIYRDELLFDRVTGQQHAFTCEPFHNLVQHNVIFDDGVSFRFERDPAESEIDFFASRDRWCRPVMARTGPDGALWVVDMYRYMIEHPEWLPQDGKDELEPYYRLGEDRGRIYRIVRKGVEPREMSDFRSTENLIAILASPNGWQRDVAQNMLVRGRHLESVAVLQRLVRESDNTHQRLHAICTLDGLGELSRETLEVALADEHPGVRRVAVELAARVQVDLAQLIRLVDDPDLKVQLQLASTLGHDDDPRAARALAAIALRSSSDPYIVAAVMSSLNERNIGQVLSAFLSEQHAKNDKVASLRASLFGQVAAFATVDDIQEAIEGTCLPTSRQHL